MSGVYPGYLMPQMPQTMMPQMPHQALFMQQSLCMQQMQQPLLQQMQQHSVFPPTTQNYPPAYLANPPTAEVDEVGGLREPNRDTSLSPAGGMVAIAGEQEEKEDYMAELSREKEVLVSRGMTREGSLLLRLLERGECYLVENGPYNPFPPQRLACVSLVMLVLPWTLRGGCWTFTGRSPSG